MSLIIVTFLSIFTRLYKINFPDYVCWDETHFGKMARSYINQTYFIDVHPPLGKLIIASIGLLCGYDGEFPFTNPGDTYISDNFSTPYVNMRVGCGLIGAMIVPISHEIVRTLTQSSTAAFMTSVLLVSDVGLITLCRYILLDPLMMFFIFSSVLFVVKMSTYQVGCNQRSDQSFGSVWWIYLILTGLCIGAAVSVKLVGLFTIAFVGAWTLVDLWAMLDNCDKLTFAKHFISRVICLILLPAAMYVSLFYLHFNLLHNSGPESSFHTSTFQASLRGNPMYNLSVPEYIDSASSITLRSTSGSYLHSHEYSIPNQQTLQQVTSYPARDGNNLWRINRIDESIQIHNGDVITLTHVLTDKTLSLVLNDEHRWMSGSTTRWDLLVAGVNIPRINNGYKWRIEKIESPNTSNGKICTIDCLIKFVNLETDCCLASTNKQLPKWGKGQQEISCRKNIPKNMKDCLWIIEDGTSQNLSVQMKLIKIPGFFSKLLETHKLMFNLNSKLLKKPGESVSKPWHWFINYKPKLFSKHEDRLYLMGTPLVWRINIIAIALICTVSSVMAICDGRTRQSEPQINVYLPHYFTNRAQINTEHNTIHNKLKAGRWFLFGWALHYFPFFTMSRVLFFHHYFPAHIFACMLSGTIIDLLSCNLAKFLHGFFNHIHLSIIIVVVAMVIHDFYLNCHLCYGR